MLSFKPGTTPHHTGPMRGLCAAIGSGTLICLHKLAGIAAQMPGLLFEPTRMDRLG